MKVLFISSAKKNNSVSPFVKSQAESIQNKGVEVEFFLIKKKGLFGYLYSVFELKKVIKKGNFDLFHSHYSLSGFTASLAGCQPLVVSLLGSDVINKKIFRKMIPFFSKKYKWKKIIVKTNEMKSKLPELDIEVVPNGVDFKCFFPMKKEIARKKLNWDKNEKIILFNGHKNNYVKNYSLALEAVSLLPFTVRLVQIMDIKHSEMNFYFNASDLLLSTSLWEGSPNVIKEAMATNTIIISTNVGDVSYLFGSSSNNFITSYDSNEIKNKIVSIYKDKIENNASRDRLTKLNLEGAMVADQIINIYKSN